MMIGLGFFYPLEEAGPVQPPLEMERSQSSWAWSSVLTAAGTRVIAQYARVYAWLAARYTSNLLPPPNAGGQGGKYHEQLHRTILRFGINPANTEIACQASSAVRQGNWVLRRLASSPGPRCAIVRSLYRRARG
jgi:hypothetical protein